ncbi:MAG: hypothetical protein IT486_06290 [Gammaproteobacteria bacterium]|nr:hypothetical protein [Gammaproteobacteria bacterium]
MLMVHAAPWILIAGLAVGGLSVDRVAGTYVELGYLGELRFILIVMAAYAAVIQSLGPNDRDRWRNGCAWWVGGVCGLHGLLVLSWLWSTQSDFSSKQIFEIVLLVLALIAASRLFVAQPGRYLVAFQRLSVAMAAVLTAVGLMWSGVVQGDLSFVGAGGIGTARVLAVSMIYMAYLFLREPRVVYLLPMPVLVLEMALSGSRSAFLGLFVGLAVLWIFRRRINDRNPLGVGSLVLLSAGVVGVLMAGLLWTPSRAIIMDFVVSNFVMDPMTSQTAGLYLADRDLIFSSAWQSFLDSFFTGAGLGSYTGPFGEIYPHNLLLNLADDAGIGAMVIFVVLLVWPVSRLVRSRDPLSVLALANAAFFFLVSMFAGTYYDSRFIWIFLLLGLLQIENGKGRPKFVVAGTDKSL